MEAAAESLAGDARAVIKIDCAEFQHSHEIAKLIGSPPGYLGHRETHPLLSQEVLNQYHTERMKLSFVLFDEIEKASDALWNLLLGILDKATLTLGDNRRVDFSRAMIFMTSNLGATEMGSMMRPNLGFAAAEAERKRATGELDEALNDKITRAGIEAARRKFTPEFMNRIDKTVVFRPLGEAELRKILTLELDIVQERVFDPRERSFRLLVTEGQRLPLAGRHGLEIRRSPLETRDRALSGASALQSDRIGAGPRRRSDPVDYDAEVAPVIREGSRGHAGVCNGPDGGNVGYRAKGRVFQWRGSGPAAQR